MSCQRLIVLLMLVLATADLLKGQQTEHKHILNKLENLETEMNQNFKRLEEQIAQLTNLVNNKISNRNKSSDCKSSAIPYKAQEFDSSLNYNENYDEADNLPADCEAALNANKQKEGIYLLKPLAAGEKPFGVVCKLYEGKIWTVIQRRQQGGVDFRRNWQEYKKGFGDLNGDYWLGLDRMHALTSNGRHELWIKFDSFEGTANYARYQNFAIDGESTSYRLTINTFGGNTTNALFYCNGRQFSTFDNEKNPRNCGNECGAWWFSDSCGKTNPNGNYGTEHSARTAIWNGEFINYFHMAIRRTGDSNNYLYK